MMETLTVVRIVRFSLCAIFTLIIFYACLRAYYLDVFRQKLFALRDELFDFAADGGIDFSDPAYLELRQDLNGLIRFAHKISMFRLLLASWTATPESMAENRVVLQAWIARVDQLPPLSKRKLMDVRHEALSEVIFFVCRRSLALSALYWLLKLAALWVNAARRLNRKLLSFAEALEAQARDEFTLAS